MSILRRQAFAPILVAASLTQPSMADALPESLRSCIKVTGNAERLACFDREAARMTSGVPKPSGGAETPLTPEQKLGLSTSRVQKLESPSGAATLSELHAHIASASASADGLQSFVLDNEQVWRQTATKTDFFVRQGDAVTISTGALGSFWLSTDSHHSTRVKRIR
jgi:hypothetical protein